MTDKLAQGLGPQLTQFQNNLSTVTTSKVTAGAGKSFQPTALEKQLFAETAGAIRKWQESPANKARLAALPGLSADEVTAFFQSILTAPEFTQMNALVEKHRTPGVNISFPLRAVSVGVDGSLVLIIGVQGSVGVAVNPLDPTDFSQAVMYASGQVEIGAGEGGEVGVVVGFWNVTPVNMGGTSYGWEVEIDDFGGGYVEASYQNADGTGLIGVSVSGDAGEEDGAEGEASYTYVWSTTPIYQPPAQNYMIINSIKCNDNSESGHDEVYFFFTIDNGTRYRYPSQGEFSMAKGDSWNAGRSIRFNSQVYVQLFDQDDTSSDDSLGSYTYTTGNFPAATTVTGSGGSYTLNAVLNPVWRAYS
ncbi:MAG: hypothetical protein QOH21_80 [Acidobacteriota bacterium]|jgi:hypothetical protein|nr:hypothetical protein [Acidobacteriota bacterium]